MMDINVYIWDLDGTLFDSYESIVLSLLDVARENGLSDTFLNVLKIVKQGSVTDYLKKLSRETDLDYFVLRNRYREYSENRIDSITLIRGALQTLEALKKTGVRHFVYTHRGSTTRPLLDRLGLTAFFTEVVTSENGFKPKPSGEAVEFLVEKYHLAKASTAYVGDRTLDMDCAVNAGVKAILYLPDGSCVNPTGKEDLIIRHLEDLVLCPH